MRALVLFSTAIMLSAGFAASVPTDDPLGTPRLLGGERAVLPMDADDVRLDGGTTDRSGNGFHGSLPAPRVLTAGRFAEGYLLPANATSNGVGAPLRLSALALANAANGTISLWVKFAESSAPGALTVPIQIGRGGVGFSMSLRRDDDTGATTFWAFNGNPFQDTVPFAYDDETWVHLSITWQRLGALRFYVDGVLVHEEFAPNLLGQSPRFEVGFARDFPSTVDELRAWDRVLSLAEIADIAGLPYKNDPPIPSFTLARDCTTVSVNASGTTDPDGHAMSFVWDWGDGTTGSGLTASHVYATFGDRVIALTAADVMGASAAWSRPYAHDSPLPIPAFDPLRSYHRVSVNASASVSPLGLPLSYAWAWGDGSQPSSGAQADHLFSGWGTRTIQLTTTDACGSASTTREVSFVPAVFEANGSFVAGTDAALLAPHPLLSALKEVPGVDNVTEAIVALPQLLHRNDVATFDGTSTTPNLGFAWGRARFLNGTGAAVNECSWGLMPAMSCNVQDGATHVRLTSVAHAGVDWSLRLEYLVD